MIRTIFAVLCALGFSVSMAAAQTCGAYPNTLTNGQTADATQVMANFNFILNCLNSFNPPPPPLQGYIGGLTLSNDGASPNTVIDVVAGVTTSDDTTTSMKILGFTKNCNAAWALGSGNGGLDSGSSLAASTWYHVYVIERTDTGVVDELCSTSATAPTLPTSYTKKRRIGSIKTDSSAHILAFTQNGDEFLWLSPPLDSSSTVTTTAALYTLSVPAGVKVNALLTGSLYSSGGPIVTYLSSPDVNDLAPSYSTVIQNFVQAAGGSYIGLGNLRIRTNTASQIRGRSNNIINAFFYTQGWLDTRGRFN